MWIAKKTSTLPQPYNEIHRADEFEARLKQMAMLKFHKHANDARNIEGITEKFRLEQIEVFNLLLENLDGAIIKQTADPSSRQQLALKVSTDEASVYVPLVKPVADERAYVREVLTRRRDVLTAPAR
jgi:hypothetical protein